VPAIDSGDVPAPPIAHRDAGASLTLSGPNQKTVVIAASAGEYFKALDQPPIVLSAADVPAPFFSDGPWIVSGAGGADVAAFQRTFTLPPPIKWTNRDAFALVDRSAGFTVAWDAQGYGPTEFVTAQILSFPPPHTTLPTGLSAGVSCRVPAQTGKLVFTPDWLQKIVPTLPGFESSVWLDVSSNTARPRMFTVALKDGSLAPVIVTSSLSDGSATVIR
jgi:hypothetical protein